MSRVVLDYLRRWSWAYLLGFVCHVAAMSLAWIRPDSVVPASVFAGSAFVLMWESKRSRGSRTLLSLPLTSRELARAWRFVALEFPALWYLLALIVSAVIVAFFGPEKTVIAGQPMLTTERFLILTWLQTVTLGTVFFGVTGIQVNGAAQHGWNARLKGAFYGLVGGFTVPFVILVVVHIPMSFADFQTGHWVVAIMLSLVTVLGWTRAEDLVLRRAQFSKVSDSPNRAVTAGGKTDRASLRAALSGLGGLPMNLLQFASTVGLFGLAILSINWAAMQQLMGITLGGAAVELDIYSGLIGLFMPIFAMIAGLILLSQLRVLKSMPLSRKAIAALLVLWPLCAGLIFGLVATLLHVVWFGGEIPWLTYDSGMLACALLVLIMPVILRFGMGKISFLVILLVLPIIQASQVLQRSYSSSWAASLQTIGPWYFLITMTCAGIAWCLCCRLLDSSHPWREGALRLPNQRRS